jgi:hypothetical protein
MNNFSVIEVADNKWSDILNKSLQYDFYHTQAYHQLEKKNRPVLFLAVFNNDFIALPLIIRKIPNSTYFDCTSAYGYCGPVSNLDFELIPNEYFSIFQEKLTNYFKQYNIITAFSRLHPLISSGAFFKDFGIVKDINKTVAVDLRISLEAQKKQYRKSNKSELNQLRIKGFEIVEAKSKEDIDAFIAIYHETMSRVDADEAYFFNHQYFYNFFKNNSFETKLLLAKKENEIAAGAIFTIANKLMQYHLAGTTQAFIKETPMKLILDEARLLGNELGLDFLHLGGGVGGSDDDSLFRFKKGFSDFLCMYQIWQMIIDEEKYDDLIQKLNADRQSNYFPLYRSV